MDDTFAVVLFVVSLYVCLITCGLLWDRHWSYRYLPILYGLGLGILVTVRFGHQGARALEDVLVGTGIGLLFLGCVWCEVRQGRNDNPQKTRRN